MPVKIPVGLLEEELELEPELDPELELELELELVPAPPKLVNELLLVKELLMEPINTSRAA
ncbi:MAG: hypothetical protein JO323_24835 [Acidobacteriia bacterium]|nr:hypothetical protein [Terriglobia bacterium]